MKKNEKLKIALLQETENAMLKMIDQLQDIEEGDLQTLEQSMLKACLCLVLRLEFGVGLALHQGRAYLGH